MINGLQKNLLIWFKKNQRPLPWRKKYEPYHVWISEVMLQQTQVETALPYFNRWIKIFPNVESLATADEKKVLKLWEGLGYYSRARNLHHSAKIISKEMGGTFPNKYESILSLKGIGRYSAGAIASIAFNQEKPIVDGNVLRVLSRVYAIKKPIDVQKNKEIFWKLQENLIPKGQARFFNQALMELGALICTSQNPLCQRCPIKNNCEAFKKNKVENYPVRQKRKKTIKVEAGALVISKNGKYLIQRRPLGEIMGGLWEFPEWKLAREQKLEPEQIKEKTLSEARKTFGEIEILKKVGLIKRNYTHHNEMLHVFQAQPIGTGGQGNPFIFSSRKGPTGGWVERTKNKRIAAGQDPFQYAWIQKKDFARYPFSSAHAKISNLIQRITIG